MLRPLDEEREQVKYSHFKAGEGFITVAGFKKEGFYLYGVAFCSPEDNFCRKHGREVAFNKLYQQAKLYSGLLPLITTEYERNSDLAMISATLVVDSLQTHPNTRSTLWYTDIDSKDIKLNSKKIRRKERREQHVTN